MRFTERVIAELTCPPGWRDMLVFDEKQRGLGVRVTSTGGKTYVAQYRFNGDKRRVSLGAVAAISLAQARALTAQIMGDRAKGVDTVSARADARADARERNRRIAAQYIGVSLAKFDQLMAEWNNGRSPIPESGPCVYFIETPALTPIKINYTNGLIRKRMKELQTGAAHPLSLIFAANVEGNRDWESRTHCLFASSRLKGEWFERTEQLLEFIDDLKAGQSLGQLLDDAEVAK